MSEVLLMTFRAFFLKEEKDEFYPRYFTGLSNAVASQLLDYIFLMYGGVKLEF